MKAKQMIEVEITARLADLEAMGVSEERYGWILDAYANDPYTVAYLLAGIAED